MIINTQWIVGDESNNLQMLTDIILSSKIKNTHTTQTTQKRNRKRKLSETSTTDSEPPLKKSRNINGSKQMQKFYDDMIQLLNDGVISYANSKKLKPLLLYFLR